MANRVYDEATLLQAVAMANAAAQVQQQSSLGQLDLTQLFPAQSNVSQAWLLDLLSRSISAQVQHKHPLSPAMLLRDTPKSIDSSLVVGQALESPAPQAASMSSEVSIIVIPKEPSPPPQPQPIAAGSPVAARSFEAPVARSDGPRNRKQERTAETFKRGCARLRTIQVIWAGHTAIMKPAYILATLYGFPLVGHA